MHEKTKTQIYEDKIQIPVILDTEHWYLSNAWKNKDTNIQRQKNKSLWYWILSTGTYQMHEKKDTNATEKKKGNGNENSNEGKYDNDALWLIGICDNSDKLRILNHIIDEGN